MCITREIVGRWSAVAFLPLRMCVNLPAYLIKAAGFRLFFSMSL